MFRTRLSLTELESRETPSGIDPVGPDAMPDTVPTVPAQLPPSNEAPPVLPPVDPYDS